jgi:hypothetical protein
MTAATSNKWIKLPMAPDVRPKSHSTRSTTKSVQSTLPSFHPATLAEMDLSLQALAQGLCRCAEPPNGEEGWERRHRRHASTFASGAGRVALPALLTFVLRLPRKSGTAFAKETGSCP